MFVEFLQNVGRCTVFQWAYVGQKSLKKEHTDHHSENNEGNTHVMIQTEYK